MQILRAKFFYTELDKIERYKPFDTKLIFLFKVGEKINVLPFKIECVATIDFNVKTKTFYLQNL